MSATLFDDPSTATGGLVLPEPFDQAVPHASLEYGKRKVTLTLVGPGTLHRCSYARAWIEVAETVWMSGEATLWARRNIGESYARESFTDAARAQIKAEVLPPIARYGFARWWTELHRAREVHTDALERAEHARRVARWWETLETIQSMYAAGDLDVVPLDRSVGQRCDHRVLVVDQWGGHSHSPALAELRADGDQVGWMLHDGSLVPVAAFVGLT